MNVSFDVSREDDAKIMKIVDRALDIFHAYPVDRLELTMDLFAVHANGCPLKLDELLEADESDFIHDVGGIRRHLNRKTGGLEHAFMPRYARGQ